jgi:hypothetical protein
MLTKGEEYTDQGQAYYEERYRQRVIANLNRRAQQLGLQVVPAVPAPHTVLKSARHKESRHVRLSKLAAYLADPRKRHPFVRCYGRPLQDGSVKVGIGSPADLHEQALAGSTIGDSLDRPRGLACARIPLEPCRGPPGTSSPR